MKSTELPALAELRESLREAAARDIAARKPRVWRRRGIAIFAAVLVSGAAAAGAADLISSGEPVNGNGSDPRYNSVGQIQIALKADDTPLPWGIQAYTSPEGQACALVGRVRGVQLGLLDVKGTFHRYREGRPGLCGSLTGKAGGFASSVTRENRTVIFGRARPGSTIRIVVDGDSHATPAGREGAFIFVFKGSVTLSDLSID